MTVCCDTVPSASANLLHISFKGTGHIIMNDSSNVRFIDAHSKCDSGNHNFYFAFHKLLLDNFALISRHTGMVNLGYCGYLRLRLLRVSRILPVRVQI